MTVDFVLSTTLRQTSLRRRGWRGLGLSSQCFQYFYVNLQKKLVLLDEIFIRFHWTATVRTTFKRICN